MGFSLMVESMADTLVLDLPRYLTKDKDICDARQMILWSDMILQSVIQILSNQAYVRYTSYHQYISQESISYTS